MNVEICVEGIDGFIAAQEAGADRVELCAALIEGGLTPSFGVVRLALALAKIPFHVIVRPRGGDFLYSALEFRSMLEDVMALKALGVAGVVVGCLTADAEIDEARMNALVAAARPLSVTCHRAFDMTRDLDAALEALVRCGIDRVLTSGGRNSAIEGLDTLRRMAERAAGRIVVMACGALDETNVAQVYRDTGVDEVHFAALVTSQGGMAWHNPHVGMGGTDKDREYQLTLTDGVAIARTIAAVRG